MTSTDASFAKQHSRSSRRTAASDMSGKPLKCPDCSFRGSTLKGMKIHRSRKHQWNPHPPRGPTHPPTLPQEFFESLGPDQLNLLEASYSSHRINLPSQQCSDSSGDSGPNTMQERSENPAMNGYSSPTSSSPGSSMPSTQRTAGTSNNSGSNSSLNSSEKQCFSNTRGGNMLETRAETTPASPTPIGEPQINPQYFASQDPTGSCQPSDPPALLYRGSGVRPEHVAIDQETKQNSSSSQEGLTQGRSPPDDTFIEYDMPGFQSIERSQASSSAFLPDSSHTRQNERPLPIEFSDEIGGMETGSRFCSVRGVVGRTLYAGRNALKNLWPACFFDLTSLQPQEDGGFLRRENELRACRNFLTLLGNCAVLDYNASSAWDLVLRCSLCEMPMSGIRNMEAHIKKHLQQTQHSGDIRC